MNKIYFKWCHKQYYQEYCQGDLLLWAHCTQTSKSHFLGCFKGNDIHESEGLREKDWNIQKGAERLFRLVFKAYYCRDLKKNKVQPSTDLQNVGRTVTILPWKLN